MNGEFQERSEAKIAVFDSAFLLGDGLWEGFRLRHGRFVHVERHLDRLFRSAAAVHLDIGKTRSELIEIINETARRNDMHSDVHMRLMVSRGTKKTPSQDPRLVVGGPTIVVIAEHKRADPSVTAVGIRLHTASVRRPPAETLDQRWNTHSKIHKVIALSEALDAGADEALMLDVDGNDATCNATNFFIVTGGEVWTSTGENCLNGITRSLVIELATEADIPVRETDFGIGRVYSTDEAFVTGTLTPVVAVDGRSIGDGKTPGVITRRLTDSYKAALDLASEAS